MSEKIKITGTTEDGRKFTGEAVVEEQTYRKPKDGEDYWYINAKGYIYQANWESSQFDNLRYRFGNVFRTKEEAEKEARARKLLQMAQRIGGGGEYYIYYADDEIKTGGRQGDADSIEPNFTTKKLAQQLIDDYHDELMWYFRGV